MNRRRGRRSISIRGSSRMRGGRPGGEEGEGRLVRARERGGEGGGDVGGDGGGVDIG